MLNTYNIYCDESCHLEHDNFRYMLLGALQCNKQYISDIKQQIYNVKKKYNIPLEQELKWSKISPSNLNMYIDVLRIFFENDCLHFRCIIADKSNLNHNTYNQTHSQWYFKIYWILIKYLINDNEKEFCIFVDPKNTNMKKDSTTLENICKLKSKVKMVEPVVSSKNVMIQLTDILIGCLKYINNDNCESVAKQTIFSFFEEHCPDNIRLTNYDNKVNIFYWDSNWRDDCNVF